MNNDNLARYGKRFVQYFYDPMPRNDDESAIWCLGRQYDSHPNIATPGPAITTSTAQSPPASDSSASQVDSAVSPDKHDQIGHKSTASEDGSFENIEQQEQDQGADNGWPAAFLDDVEARIWLTYRSNFPTIAKSADPKAASALSFSTRLKNLGSQGGFSSDTGWGCMIRSGQSLLANALAVHELGRDWRKGQQSDAERQLLSLFADDPSAPFSIHRFVEHGASACGKHPGEWFGPSATARCIQALTSAHSPSDLRVYVRPDDSDVYEDSFMRTARGEDGSFKPTLVLLGTRLGIDRVTPVYWEALKAVLCLPQSIGIAGGRPSSSHYFIGTQANSFFYLDPHTTRPFLPLSPTDADMASCHTRRLRRIHVTEMDPSMLLGFLIRSEDEWRAWRTSVSTKGETGGKLIVQVHDTEPKYSGAAGFGGEGREGQREEAVDEVQSCDESDDDTVVC
ncbi:hypothetical protein MBLNU459_g2691t1 [Dothideomycetes sp. NU459]